MPKFSCVLVILFALALSACGDDSVPTDTNNNGGDGPGKDEFAIVSVDEDSVYWDERIVITLQNARLSPLRVIIHTLTLNIDSQWVDGAGKTHLRIVIPEGASTGKLRVYDGTDALAKGDFLVVVFDVRKRDLESRIYSYGLDAGYPGDVLSFIGEDMPLRRSDIEVKIGNVIIPIESIDSTSITTRLPVNVKTGSLTVKLFDKLFPMQDEYRILTHEGELLPQDHLQKIRIDISGIAGLGSRHFVEEDQHLLFGNVLSDIVFFDLARQTENMSSKDLIFVDSQETEFQFLKVEVRLTRESESRVSGVIRFSNTLKDGSHEISAELELNGMRWRKIGNEYKILAFARDVSTHLARYSYVSNMPTIREMHIYEKTLQDASVSILLTP